MSSKVMARPTDYNEDVASRILEKLVEGSSLRKTCAAEDMPAASTVFLWLSRHPEFSERYTRAREAQAEAMAEDTLDIADDGTNDFKKTTNADGSTDDVFNSEHVQRSKLRVDTRKWLMAKMAPKKYGDKLDLNVAGSLQTMSEEDINARLTQLLGKAGIGASAGGAGEAEKA
ncbi:terminase small subunit protein [Mesorhizobium sp. M0400]|uniref:terminase small subunit-like protein n=1 Tax=Mesorhizobium sp. M0400 TaxID=2956941 RepID=UPI00333D8455